MDLIYKNERIEKCCNSIKEARKLFGGDDDLAKCLLGRINALKVAESLFDIVIQPQFHFHKLHDKGKNKFEGCFAIDLKSRKTQWRIILEPLDNNKKPYDPCHIDKIAKEVKSVGIVEVSKHYE